MKEPGCERKGQARGLGAIDRRDDEAKKSRGDGLTWINLSHILWEFELVN